MIVGSFFTKDLPRNFHDRCQTWEELLAFCDESNYKITPADFIKLQAVARIVIPKGLKNVFAILRQRITENDSDDAVYLLLKDHIIRNLIPSLDTKTAIITLNEFLKENDDDEIIKALEQNIENAILNLNLDTARECCQHLEPQLSKFNNSITQKIFLRTLQLWLDQITTSIPANHRQYAANNQMEPFDAENIYSVESHNDKSARILWNGIYIIKSFLGDQKIVDRIMDLSPLNIFSLKSDIENKIKNDANYKRQLSKYNDANYKRQLSNYNILSYLLEDPLSNSPQFVTSTVDLIYFAATHIENILYMILGDRNGLLFKAAWPFVCDQINKHADEEHQIDPKKTDLVDFAQTQIINALVAHYRIVNKAENIHQLIKEFNELSSSIQARIVSEEIPALFFDITSLRELLPQFRNREIFNFVLGDIEVHTLNEIDDVLTGEYNGLNTSIKNTLARLDETVKAESIFIEQKLEPEVEVELKQELEPEQEQELKQELEQPQEHEPTAALDSTEPPVAAAPANILPPIAEPVDEKLRGLQEQLSKIPETTLPNLNSEFVMTSFNNFAAQSKRARKKLKDEEDKINALVKQTEMLAENPVSFSFATKNKSKKLSNTEVVDLLNSADPSFDAPSSQVPEQVAVLLPKEEIIKFEQFQEPFYFPAISCETNVLSDTGLTLPSQPVVATEAVARNYKSASRFYQESNEELKKLALQISLCPVVELEAITLDETKNISSRLQQAAIQEVKEVAPSPLEPAVVPETITPDEVNNISSELQQAEVKVVAPLPLEPAALPPEPTFWQRNGAAIVYGITFALCIAGLALAATFGFAPLIIAAAVAVFVVPFIAAKLTAYFCSVDEAPSISKIDTTNSLSADAKNTTDIRKVFKVKTFTQIINDDESDSEAATADMPSDKGEEIESNPAQAAFIQASYVAFKQ